ncbi:MAG TPA: EAL domain-containing protein, partial [Polyangiaceae bacterium]|nr:EAL domain-containing protein [Polyangiaceae bacterium]
LLNAYARTLRDAGYVVDTAPDGEVAARKLRESSYDTIVSDIAMPRMTGIDLLRVVREHDLDVPVVLITGSASLDTAMDAVRFGALRYLTKPFELDELIAIVGHAVGLARIARAKRDALILLGEHNRLLGDRAAREAHFHRAVKSLWMAYQPIVSWSQRSVHAYEALVRSEEPTMRGAGEILDMAEALDAMRELGRNVRAKAGEFAVQAHGKHYLFVNLHADDLLDELLALPTEPLSQVAPAVVLEITERAALHDVDEAKVKIEELRSMGFRIALDDLGAGYAGLTSFTQIRPDVVKLDMALVRDVDKDAVKRKLIRSIIDVSRDMGTLVVGEGVETAGERDVLVEMGCHLLQGYLFGKPSRI